MHDQSTEQVLFPEGEEYISTSLELVVSGGELGLRRLPLSRAQTRIAGHDHSAHLQIDSAPTMKISWLDHQLVFWSDPQGNPTLLNGQPCRSAVLHLQDVVSWDEYQFQVVDRAHQLRATLECICSPFFARIWPIDEELTLIGRRGQRLNHVELDHPTISRSHATISWQSNEPILRTDTKTSLVVVDGKQVPPDHTQALVDGASLQLGELTFRFRLLREVDPRLRGPRLSVRSLGTFSVERGGDSVAEKNWRTSNVRWLMARLAQDWGRPVAAEVLLELFWPGM